MVSIFHATLHFHMPQCIALITIVYLLLIQHFIGIMNLLSAQSMQRWLSFAILVSIAYFVHMRLVTSPMYSKKCARAMEYLLSNSVFFLFPYSLPSWRKKPAEHSWTIIFKIIISQLWICWIKKYSLNEKPCQMKTKIAIRTREMWWANVTKTIFTQTNAPQWG